jgi:OOP family OmpA-OmpF porin
MQRTSNPTATTSKHLTLGLVLGLSLLLSACAVGTQGTPATQSGTPASANLSSIEALAERFNLTNSPVSASQSRVIFYRPLASTVEGASSIYINGRYHTSLVPGGYSPICIPPGKVELGVRHMDVQNRPNKDGFDSITEMRVTGGENQFIRVHDQGPRSIVLMPVRAQQALQELQSTRLQVHTVSRVANASECIDAPAQPVQVAPATSSQQLQLAGDTLFRFNRSDRAGLTQDGLRAIDQLMAQIRNQFIRVDQIHIIGHADPIGNDRANQILSAARAQTVHDYIASRYDPSTRITSEGRGEREPVVRCGDRPTPANIACNQPNRRVALEVTGQQR